MPRFTKLVAVLLVVVAGAGFVVLWRRHQNMSNRQNAIPYRPAATTKVFDGSTPDAAKATPVGDYVLHIDEIGVNVPIVLNVDGLDDAAYYKALESGVAHYKGTPKPGEPGRSVIFGHSSYYADKPGSYKEIFKQLGSLKAGDSFTIVHASATFSYQVIESKEISAADTSVLDDSKDEQVALLTCWPPGTTTRRWLIEAKRTDVAGTVVKTS